MKLTEAQLDEALEGLFKPYPIAPQEEEFTLLSTLRNEHRQYIEEALAFEASLSDHAYSDIADDIHNCGRNPLSKFMQMAQILWIIKSEDAEGYMSILTLLSTELSNYTTVEELTANHKSNTNNLKPSNHEPNS